MSRYLLPAPLYSCDRYSRRSGPHPLTTSRPLPTSCTPFTSPGSGCQSAHTCDSACRTVCPADSPCVVSRAPPRWETAPHICREREHSAPSNRRKSRQRNRARSMHCTTSAHRFSTLLLCTCPHQQQSARSGKGHAKHGVPRGSVPQ
jgi:hypothetical protein